MPLKKAQGRTIGQLLEDIEMKYKISGNELARLLGLSSTDYHGKYKTVYHKKPTLWQRTALLYISEYGLDALKKEV